MRKTALKTFTLSFVLTLAIVFKIDRSFLYPEKSHEEIIMPSKNISLFFKHENPGALSVESIDIQELEAVLISSGDSSNTSEISLYLPDESLSLAEDVFESSENTLEESVAKNNEEDAYTELFADNFEDFIKKHPPVDDEIETSISDKQIVEKLIEPEALPADSLPENSSVAAADTSFIQKEELTEEFRIVSADRQEDNFLIPIERENPDFSSPENEIRIAQEIKNNDVALIDSSVPIRNIADKQAEKEVTWESMAEKSQKTEENPWVVARAGKFPKNKMVLESDYYKNTDAKLLKKTLSDNPVKRSESEIKVASDMVQNILIPIPEEIMQEENLTPKLISSQKTEGIDTQHMRESENQISGGDGKKTILQNITSIFSGTGDEVGPPTSDKVKPPKKKGGGFFGQITKTSKRDEPVKILPTEIRLSFQPNRAEISGQTLRWIEAFAKKAQTDNSIILEIRIDGTSSFELQQKRLNLLKNVLINKGAPSNKINIVFTTREPNSFVVRTLKIIGNEDDKIEDKKPAESSAYYQQW